MLGQSSQPAGPSDSAIAIDPRQLYEHAAEAIRVGRLELADAIIRDAADAGSPVPFADFLLGQIAVAIGDQRRALTWLRGVLPRLKPGSPAQRQTQQLLLHAARTPAPKPAPGPRIHLIKAWGYGFCSDLDQVVGHLLLAELTGRVPVVQWGTNSLFRDAPTSNAWEVFFEPVSNLSLGDARAACADAPAYPPKWTPQTIELDNHQKWLGPGSRLQSISYLHRPERLTVADYFCQVIQLLPWAPPDSPYAGIEPADAYSRLFDRFIRPRRCWIERAEAFVAAHLAGRPSIALHLRGSDKREENTELDSALEALLARAAGHLRDRPDARLFLMTDSEPLRLRAMEAFPGRVATTAVARTNTDQGVHYQTHASRESLGGEVLTDCLIAARCDRFIGGGFTNVSCIVSHLRRWPPDACELIVPPISMIRNQRLHSMP